MRLAALLALSVLLAGCAVPLGSESPQSTIPHQQCHADTSTTTPMPPTTPASTPASASHVEVRGDSERLPVNATVVWLRVLALRGLSPADIPAPVVTVSPGSGQTFSQTELDADMNRFSHLLGLNENQSEAVTLTGPDGYVAPPQFTDGNYTRVNMKIDQDDPAAAVEATLAHEYVHVVQVETNFSLTDAELAELQASVSPAMFADVREGAAEYVADAYAERYLDGINLLAERRTAYEQARPNAWKLSRAGYYYGYCHVATRVDSPRKLSAVYQSSPETEEQLIHGLSPDEEPPAPLPIQTGQGWQPRGTFGELHLQVALTEHLTESRAFEAAAGWGNDTLLSRGEDYVWVVRMDDAANTSDLEAALDSHVDGLRTTTDPIDRSPDVAYRVVRVDEETLAIAAGGSRFVETVRISADDGSVTVRAEDTSIQTG